MSEIQVGQINSTDGSTAITTGADGYVSFAKTQIGGRRNLIINGAMQVAQYGTSTTSNGTKCVDRYINYQNVGTFTAEQSTDTPVGFSYSLKRTNGTGTSATGANYSLVRYRVEDKDIAHLNFGTSDAIQFTVSFWVKSSVTGTYVLGLCDGTEERTYAANYTISSANTWEQKFITLYASTQTAWSTTGNVGLSINWDLGSGADRQVTTAGEWTTATPSTGGSWTHSSRVDWVGTTGATFYLTGVQLEVGTVATPFEHRSYGEELALCQRYYYNSHEDGDFSDYHGQTVVFAAGTSTFGGTCTVITGREYPTTMRATPTVTIYHQDGTVGAVYRVHDAAKITGVSAYFVTRKGFLYGYAVNAFNQAYGYYYGYTADAEL